MRDADETTPETFDACFDDLVLIAYRVAYRIVGQRDEALDLAQEAMARAFARWRRVHTHAPAWVSRTTTNLALDVVRKRSRAVGELRDSVGASPDESHATVTRADLVELLERLPKRQREVVVMRYLADISEADVARLLGLSPGTVKRHANRGLAALRRAIQPEAEPTSGEVPAVGLRTEGAC